MILPKRVPFFAFFRLRSSEIMTNELVSRHVPKTFEVNHLSETILGAVEILFHGLYETKAYEYIDRYDGMSPETKSLLKRLD